MQIVQASPLAYFFRPKVASRLEQADAALICLCMTFVAAIVTTAAAFPPQSSILLLFARCQTVVSQSA